MLCHRNCGSRVINVPWSVVELHSRALNDIGRLIHFVLMFCEPVWFWWCMGKYIWVGLSNKMTECYVTFIGDSRCVTFIDKHSDAPDNTEISPCWTKYCLLCNPIIHYSAHILSRLWSIVGKCTWLYQNVLMPSWVALDIYCNTNYLVEWNTEVWSPKVICK